MTTPGSVTTEASKPSLRAQLVRHVLVPLGLTWLLGTAVVVAVAYHYAQKAFDRALLDDAYALAARVRMDGQALTFDLSRGEVSAVLFDQSEQMFFAVRRADGSMLAGHPGLRVPDAGYEASSRFVDIHYNGQSLRSVVLRRHEPMDFEVVVAQTQGSRDALLHKVLWYSVAPQLLLLVGLTFWLRRIIGQELRPLSELQQSVDQRDALDLTPVQLDASTRDIEHLSAALNALLARVSHSMQAQREFSGNVAHELRTPLAGIRALAEYGLAQTEPRVWREQLQRIVASEARASRLVEQLLALAMADEADTAVQIEPVALDAVVRETVLRYLPRADAAGVDLGVQGLEEPVWVAGSVALIEGVLGNLLDNALRYGRAPQGQTSTVTVALVREDGAVRLSVIDNGPGLTPAQRLEVLQRGARGLHAARVGEGAGLGLAIVRKFVALMHASFVLDPAPAGPGLCASVTFPAAR
jgi:two-component system sensor histidine kinase TctE